MSLNDGRPEVGGIGRAIRRHQLGEPSDRDGRLDLVLPEERMIIWGLDQIGSAERGIVHIVLKLRYLQCHGVIVQKCALRGLYLEGFSLLGRNYLLELLYLKRLVSN